MPKGYSYDIVAVVRRLTEMLEPVANSQAIRLSFQSKQKRLLLKQDTAALLSGLTSLLYKMISYVPADNRIDIRLQKRSENECNGDYMRVTIVNTGINLSRLSALNNCIRFSIQESQSEKMGTCFQIDFPLVEGNDASGPPNSEHVSTIPAYYAQFRNRFITHFSKPERLVAALSNVNPREAAFLRKVNALISENIGNPHMDANFLSNAMHMSRTQLFRRLKPIIRQSPGGYIKALKLQKAKELLETTDLRVNEVAFKSGFESPSHFTKAFARHFGVRPSLFSRSKCNK